MDPQLYIVIQSTYYYTVMKTLVGVFKDNNYILCETGDYVGKETAILTVYRYHF